MKIIPAIDLMDGKVVRLYKGDPTKKTIYSDKPVEIAKKWESAGADILHIVDLDATLGNGENLETIKEIAIGNMMTKYLECLNLTHTNVQEITVIEHENKDTRKILMLHPSDTTSFTMPYIGM